MRLIAGYGHPAAVLAAAGNPACLGAVDSWSKSGSSDRSVLEVRLAFLMSRIILGYSKRGGARN